MKVVNLTDERVVSVEQASTMDVFHFGASKESGLRFLGWVAGDEDRRRTTVHPLDLEAAREVARIEAQANGWI